MRGHYLNFTDKQLDMHVYRIMKQDYVFSLFQKKENVLVQPNGWKDKFENLQLRIGGILNGEEFEYKFRDDFVGQCWTSRSLSEAMWGIYANDPNQRFLRIRSTPRKLLEALETAHPKMPQETCFIGKVQYQNTKQIREFVENGGELDVSSERFARSLLIKRSAFKHESEVRLLFSGMPKDLMPMVATGTP